MTAPLHFAGLFEIDGVRRFSAGVSQIDDRVYNITSARSFTCPDTWTITVPEQK
jgi:hypothetical protein